MLLLLPRFLSLFHSSPRPLSLLPPARLAPQSGSQRRTGFLDGWEEWLRMYSALYACKEVSAFRYHRFLRKMVNQASAEDGVLRERLGPRRYARISHSVPSSISDLGMGRISGLPAIVEIDDSMGVPDDERDGSFCPNRDLPSPVGVSDSQPPICPLMSSLEPTQVQIQSEGLGVAVTEQVVSSPSSEALDSLSQVCASSMLLPLLSSGGSGTGVVVVSSRCVQGLSGDSDSPGDPIDLEAGAEVADEQDAAVQANGEVVSAIHDRVTTDCSSLLTANLVEVPIGLADLEVADSREVMADLVELEVREETGLGDECLVVDDPVEGGQQVPLVVGVALRLPSTDGRGRFLLSGGGCGSWWSWRPGGEFGGVWEGGFSL
ncbi:hypothetical protein Dimus_026796 [Dionaea muscipula]